MPDTVEFGETAPHGKCAGRAFRRAGAFPAAEAGDDPGSPGEGPWGMGIFLPGSASFILELKGGEEFDLVGFEEVAGGLRHLAVAGADQSHDATRCSSGDDRELHQSVGSFQLAGFNVEALAFHHPEQLLDVPAQAIPSDDPQRRLDILDLVRRPQPPMDGLLARRHIIFADIDHAQSHLRRRCARAQMGRTCDRHLSESQFELGDPRLALAGLGFQRQPETVNHRHRRHGGEQQIVAGQLAVLADADQKVRVDRPWPRKLLIDIAFAVLNVGDARAASLSTSSAVSTPFSQR